MEKEEDEEEQEEVGKGGQENGEGSVEEGYDGSRGGGIDRVLFPLESFLELVMLSPGSINSSMVAVAVCATAKWLARKVLRVTRSQGKGKE